MLGGEVLLLVLLLLGCEGVVSFHSHSIRVALFLLRGIILPIKLAQWIKFIERIASVLVLGRLFVLSHDEFVLLAKVVLVHLVIHAVALRLMDLLGHLRRILLGLDAHRRLHLRKVDCPVLR